MRKEKEIVIELKEKDENLGMPLQVGKCILKKKKNWQMDMIRWKLGVG